MHDPAFTPAARRAFMAYLTEHKIRYADLAEALEIAGKPRPSEGGDVYRSNLRRLVARGLSIYQIADLVPVLRCAPTPPPLSEQEWAGLLCR